MEIGYPGHDVTRPTDLVATLLERIREGDDVESNFENLFTRFYSRVFRSFPPEVGREDREELTLDVFERVYRNIGRAPTDESGFARWVHRIAKNLYLNWVRHRTAAMRNATEVPIPDEDDSGILTPVAPDDVVSQVLSREALVQAARAIRQLPPQQRRCLQLKVFGLSAAEIATEMACSVNTVKSHVRTARAKLRHLVQRSAPWPDPESNDPEGSER